MDSLARDSGNFDSHTYQTTLNSLQTQQTLNQIWTQTHRRCKEHYGDTLGTSGYHSSTEEASQSQRNPGRQKVEGVCGQPTAMCQDTHLCFFSRPSKMWREETSALPQTTCSTQVRGNGFTSFSQVYVFFFLYLFLNIFFLSLQWFGVV